MNSSQQQLIAKIKAACAAKLKTSTLGGKSSVTFGSDKNGDYVKAGQSTYRITESLLSQVTRRYITLANKPHTNRLGSPNFLSAAEYTSPRWRKCPNHLACPFIAAALQPRTASLIAALGSGFHAGPADEFLFHIIARACVNSGIQRSARLGKKAALLRREARNLLVGQYLKALVSVQKGSATPFWYISLVKAFRSNCLKKGKASPDKFTFGHAQKIVGLWWKYLWALGLTVQPPIFPVDSTILKYHPKSTRRLMPMLKVTSRDLLDLLRVGGGPSLAALWECSAWNAKHIR